jgi:hypothetical protein
LAKWPSQHWRASGTGENGAQRAPHVPVHRHQGPQELLQGDGQDPQEVPLGRATTATGGKCKVNWSGVCRPLHCGGLGIIDLERFGRALCLRWLWLKWKSPDKPWCAMELLVDEIDEALFATATRVTVHNGKTAKFWTSS